MPPNTDGAGAAAKRDAPPKERKYTSLGPMLTKRTFSADEWQMQNGYDPMPLFDVERVLNEAACLRFIAVHTDIPVPKVHACWQFDGTATISLDSVKGVRMSELSLTKRDIVAIELAKHLETMKKLKSRSWGGLDGHVLPPRRVINKSDGLPWVMRPREKEDLVFCHNNLTADNVIVNPDTLKIAAIIDWEYAGFFPAAFERPWYLRPGPAAALEGEDDDVDALVAAMSEGRP